MTGSFIKELPQTEAHVLKFYDGKSIEPIEINKQLDLWYSRPAVQHIRPVDIKALTSQRYWEKWDRVGHDQLKAISDRFFERLWKIENPGADCLLFDTTNYYTFMSSSTPNLDWTTPEIIETSLDRWQVEDCFRLSKDDDLVGVQPLRHWTDSKIRCHLFTCVVAMVYLRRLELKLMAAGVNRTAANVMEDMRHLHSVLTLANGRRKPQRRLECPTKTQSEVLSALGHYVTKGGVLQPLKR